MENFKNGFLDVVHDIDYSPLPKNPELGDMLAKLPGRRLIYTNGSVKHATDTLTAMDVDPGLFEGMFDIVASDFEPKPKAEPFAKCKLIRHVRRPAPQPGTRQGKRHDNRPHHTAKYRRL